MTRRVAWVLIVPLLTAAGCTSPELQTTRVDVERTFAAAGDPWAAPTTLSFPSQMYGGSNVLRQAGARETRYPGHGDRQVAQLEVAAARSEGWSLVAATCGDGEPSVSLVLSKGDGLADGALAEVEVRDGEARVVLQVPHHRDGSWPSHPALTPASTCLGGGQVDQPPVRLPFEPHPGDGAEPSLEDFEPWQRDSLSREERAFREDLMAEPFVASLDLDLLDVSLDTGDNWRHDGSGTVSLPGRAATTRASVAAQVAAMPGWQATWASCGRGLPASASLMREVDGTVVTVRLTSSTADEIEVLLGLPIPEVPSLDKYLDDTPALADSRCLAETTREAALPEGLLVEGTPVALPGSLHPYLGG